MTKQLSAILFESGTNSNEFFNQHFHNTYSIGITHKGLIESFYNNTTVTSHSLTTRINNPNELHGGLAKNWSNTYFYPNIEIMTNIYFQIFNEKKAPVFLNHIVDDEILYHKLQYFFNSMYLKRDNLEIEINAIDAISYLILNYSRNEKTLDNLFNNKEIIKNSIELINDNLYEALNLDTLCNSVNLSKYHFLRVFKRELGLTPHQYIINQRIEKAKNLISKGHSIVEAALEVGFKDQSHFNRNFKRFYDYSPTQLIKNRNIVL